MVVFPPDERHVPCPECGVTLGRKEPAGQSEPPAPQPSSAPPPGRRRRKKKAKHARGRKFIPLLIAGISVFGVLLVGSLLWMLWPTKKPPVAEGPGNADAPGRPVVQAPPAPPAPVWKAKPDPPATTDFPAEGFIDLKNQPGIEILQSELRGRHVVHLAAPTVEPKNVLVLRVLDLHTGKSVSDIPQQLQRFAVSEDGKRVASLIDETPAKAPRNAPRNKVLKVHELPGLKVLRSIAVGDIAWHDFAGSPDVLLAGFGNSHLGGHTVMFADLKAEPPMFKPLPLARSPGRGGGLVAISPGRGFLAVTGERHVEVFNLADCTPAGLLEAPGLVNRCVFSTDGKELLVFSRSPTERVVTVLQREQTPLQWTTYSMEDGRQLRQVEATGAINASAGLFCTGPDPESIVLKTALELHLFDIRLGATFEVRKKKALRPLDSDRLIVFDQDRARITVEKLDKPALDARRSELRQLLGERPEAVAPDTKGARLVSAAGAPWAVPVAPAPGPLALPFQSVNCPDPHNELLYPRADAASWSVIVGKLEDRPRYRYALAWKKIDLQTGNFGPAIPLWPCAVAPGQVPAGFGFSTLKVDQTAANDKLALRDPKNPGRIDVWDDTGKRRTGFYPRESKAEVTWLAWANGDRLLTLADGTLTGWDGPNARAIFQADGKYTVAFLSPARKWVAAANNQHLDLFDPEDGKPLGRLALPGEGDWPALGASADGVRLLAARTVRGGNSRVQLPGMIEYAVWDLRNGALLRTDKAFGNYSPHPGAILHELSERQFLVGNTVLDLDCKATVATLLLPTEPAAFPLAMHGNRLWFPVVPRGTGNAFNNVKQMLSKEIPGDLVNFPKITPADVVFRPGTTVKVSTELGNRSRNTKARELFEKSLRDGGYILGDGGWTLEVTGKAGAGSQRLTATGGRTIAVPSVSGSVRLVAPDGSAVTAGGFHGSFGQRRSKYFVSSENVGLGGSITHYNFGGRDPGEAMADEAWEDAMQALPMGLGYPRILAKIGGKLTPLPVEVKVK
jgi:hypothetical protein